MSDQFWISFWGNIPALIAAIGSFVAMLISIKMNKNLGYIHQQINSRMDQLLVTTAVGARAEGVKDTLDKLKG